MHRLINNAVKEAFGLDEAAEVQQLSTGLINHTFKIILKNGTGYLLQNINTEIFKRPDHIQKNYLIIQEHLDSKKSFQLPKIIPTDNGELLLNIDNQVWRCFEFIKNTYSPATSSGVEEANRVAACFGKFSADLDDLNPGSIFSVLPRFHDLQFRFEQFEDALKNTLEELKTNAKSLIEEAFENKDLVDFYNKIVKHKKEFPLHILHHDCKIANILFIENTNKIHCPIDLDTTQSGLFFSDLGDMIRSIVPNLSENETEFDNIVLRTDFYSAVKDGYLQSMQKYLTKDELEQIDMSGKIVVYMQSLRFLTDYLNGNIYYHTDYPEQNKNRAVNQFALLRLLKDYINNLSSKKIYIG